MTEKLRQSLSAAMDDEADAFELRRVLDELGRDDELKSLWDRYHLIGTALRGESTELADGLRERVWAALDADDDERIPEPREVVAEPLMAIAQAPAKRSPVGRYTGLAVAASVAFAVVIGFSGLTGSDAGTGPAVAGDGAVGPAIAQRLAPALPAADAPLFDAADEVSRSDLQRNHAYMLHHAQQQALNQGGVMSFVKLATYEAP
jgi:sigma-E factor negative regulatory protein RseA